MSEREELVKRLREDMQNPNVPVEVRRHCSQAVAALSAQPQQVNAEQTHVRVPVEMPETFAQWFESQVPPGTVISNPRWWAPKIHRAMLRAATGKESE
jgi:hypothetical protein